MKTFYMQIQCGTGGDDAFEWTLMLFNMYTKYLDKKSIKYEIIDINHTDHGVRQVLLEIHANINELKSEEGIHRLVRISPFNAQNKRQTSFASVSLENIEKYESIKILNKDLRVDTFRASGAGGQHVNTTDSAVRITHIPTGIVASCQDGRSQLKNKEQAMILLKSKLYDYEKQIQNTKISQERQESSLNAERSEKIRTYNEPQGRITDHRCNVTLYKYESILKGNLNELFDEIHKYNLSN